MIIGIIGAGASGMAAALAAADCPGAQVLLFERQSRVGKKLSATGNGRCNLSNLNALSGGYHGEDASFVNSALEKLPPAATLAWFRSLGLFTVTEPSGRVYPFSDQANSVVDVLRLALVRENITLHTGVEITRVRKEGTGFLLEDKWYCDRVIIACGGLAGTRLGGSLSGYKLLSKFGHRATRLRPSLVQLRCDWPHGAALKGVRAECTVTIRKNEEFFAGSKGEIQFTEQGLSGPVMFEVSRDACSTPGEWFAEIDLLPQVTPSELLAELVRRKDTALPFEELLTGIVHNRLGRVLVKMAGVRGRALVAEVSDEEMLDICCMVKSCRIKLTEPLGMDSAQVTAGGVLTEGFDPDTMESKLVPGLYACGEVLDIDGDCGGYNLQWAWSSGILAGLCAGREEQ